MNSGKQRVGVVDVNGKFTHVWKNLDRPGSSKVTDRLGNIQGMYVPFGQKGGESNFEGISFSPAPSGGITSFSTGEAPNSDVRLTDPELRAVSKKLSEYPIEWGKPTNNTVEQFGPNIKAGWDGESFVIQEIGRAQVKLDPSDIYELNSTLDQYIKAASPMTGWHDTSGYVGIVESPVSDRDMNYHLTLGENAMLTTYISDSGLADEYGFGRHDRDQVTFFTSSPAERIGIQIEYNDDYFYEATDHMDEDEFESFKEKVNSALAEIDPNLTANFENEGIFSIMYNDNTDVEHDKDGNATFFTSNVLHKYGESEHLDKIDNAFQAVWNIQNES